MITARTMWPSSVGTRNQAESREVVISRQVLPTHTTDSHANLYLLTFHFYFQLKYFTSRLKRGWRYNLGVTWRVRNRIKIIIRFFWLTHTTKIFNTFNACGTMQLFSPTLYLKTRIRIRASSTMVGIQAMTRSISQFLNRHSQSLGRTSHHPVRRLCQAAPLQIKTSQKGFENQPGQSRLSPI